MEPGLNTLPPANRLWFTFFLISILLGLAAAIGQHIIITEMDPAKTAAYYRGGEVGDAIQFEKPLQDMFRVTHTHLFGTGLVLFVLCRIFALAPVSNRTKMLTFTAAYSSLFLSVIAPWLVRFVSGSFSRLVGISAILLSVVMLGMIVSSLYFMWRGKRK